MSDEQTNTNAEIRLLIPDDVQQVMNDRGIRLEDIHKTIHHAESTGEKFIKPSIGRCLVSFRPDRVTFWVEYSPVDEGYLVHSAYSHRMEMKRKGRP